MNERCREEARLCVEARYGATAQVARQEDARSFVANSSNRLECSSGKKGYGCKISVDDNIQYSFTL